MYPTSQSGDLDRRLWRTCQLLSLWHWGHSLLFGMPNMFKFFRWSLRHSTSSWLVPAAITSLPLLVSSPTLALSSHSVLFIFLFTLISLADLVETVFSILLFYLATMGLQTLVSPGKQRGWWLAGWGLLLVPFAIPCSTSLISRIHSFPFSDWRRAVSSKFFDTHSTEKLELPR